MSELDDWWVHTVIVETYVGAGSRGDVLAPPEPLLVLFEDVTQLLRRSDGTEVTSNATVFADLALAEKFTPGSVVTDVRNRKSEVVGLDVFDTDPDPGGGLNHIEVRLS